MNEVKAPGVRGNGHLGIPEFRAFFKQFGDDADGTLDRGNTLFYAVFKQARLSGVRGGIEYQVLCRDCGQHVSKTCTYRRERHRYEHGNFEVSELSLKEHVDDFDRLVLSSIDTRMKHDMRLLVANLA